MPALVAVLVALAWGVLPRPGPASDRGERVFQRCFACHSVVAGEDASPRPNLRTVVGRRAGSLPAVIEYLEQAVRQPVRGDGGRPAK